MAPESTLKEIEVEAILADGEGGVVDGGGAGGLREVDDEEARWSRQNLESGECRYFAAPSSLQMMQVGRAEGVQAKQVSLERP